jgi:flavin-dependent dehydrogenase
VTSTYDVVVAGGGPAGSAAALALAARGRAVLLVDAATGPRPIGEALPSAARMLLRDLGVAGTVPGDGHQVCYANRSAWGSDTVAATDSINDPHGPGWHLDRPLFDHRLREAAQAAGVEVRIAAVRSTTRQQGGSWRVILREPRRRATVHCRWVVDATGRRAAVATTHGARRLTGDRLIALHLTLGPSAGTDATTLVEATRDGWWYSAQLPDRRLLLSYFTDSDLPTSGSFRRQLAATGPTAARAAAHPLPQDARPGRAPAHTARLNQVHGDGWTATGDAATAFDPLSSQGILTALYTGQAAGTAVHDHLDGDPHALDQYAAAVTAVTAAYQRNRSACYALEQRWPDRPFWHRRSR